MPIDSPGIAQAYLATRPKRRAAVQAPARTLGGWRGWLLGLTLAVIALGALAQDTMPETAVDAVTQDAAPEDFRSLDGEVQELKQQVVDLNRDLFMLEEELLFPANTQVAVFISMDVGTFFALDGVQIEMDGKEVANYLYTQREVDALIRGGVHRVWLGNLKAGKHELTAFFTGVGTHERDYKRGATLEIEKGVGAKYVELKISDRARKLQPEFIVKEWE